MKINQITQSSSLWTKDIIDHSSKAIQHINFGAIDRLKRAIGMKIETFMVTFVECEKSGYGWHYPTGTYYACYMQATRNGIRYGAHQGTQYFADLESRQAYIEKRLTAAKKQKH